MSKIQKIFFWKDQNIKIEDSGIDYNDIWNNETRTKMIGYLQSKINLFDSEHEVDSSSFATIEDGNGTFGTIQILERLDYTEPNKQPCSYFLRLYNSGKWELVSWLYYHMNYLCVFGYKSDNIIVDPRIPVWDQETIEFEGTVNSSTRHRLTKLPVESEYNRCIGFIKLPVVKETEFSDDEDFDLIIEKDKKQWDELSTCVNDLVIVSDEEERELNVSDEI